MSDKVIQQAQKLTFRIHIIVPSKLALAEIFPTCTCILVLWFESRSAVKKSKEMFFFTDIFENQNYSSYT